MFCAGRTIYYKAGTTIQAGFFAHEHLTFVDEALPVSGRRPIRSGFFSHEHLTLADEALPIEALLVSGRRIVLQLERRWGVFLRYWTNPWTKALPDFRIYDKCLVGAPRAG